MSEKRFAEHCKSIEDLISSRKVNIKDAQVWYAWEIKNELDRVTVERNKILSQEDELKLEMVGEKLRQLNEALSLKVGK